MISRPSSTPTGSGEVRSLLVPVPALTPRACAPLGLLCAASAPASQRVHVLVLCSPLSGYSGTAELTLPSPKIGPDRADRRRFLITKVCCFSVARGAAAACPLSWLPHRVVEGGGTWAGRGTRYPGSTQGEYSDSAGPQSGYSGQWGGRSSCPFDAGEPMSTWLARDMDARSLARPSLIPSLCTHFTRAGIEWRR